MPRPAVAYINLNHLQHNYKIAKQFSKTSCYAVIKADAYGHGLIPCAEALADLSDGFACASIDEALIIRNTIKKQPVLVLQGAYSPDDWLLAETNNLNLVIHQHNQIEQLQIAIARHNLNPKLINVFIKINTGMNRLGFAAQQLASICQQVEQLGVTITALMSHFACADEIDHPANQQQIAIWQSATQALAKNYAHSFNNSAALIQQLIEDDISRAGIMLYSENNQPSLKAVMSLHSQVIALNNISQGQCVGYGHSWQAEQDGQLALVSIGYGDGYPRQLPTGTPVLINGKRYPLVGRVSMDVITVFIAQGEIIKIGDDVELWGENIKLEEIAKLANTISYELACQVTKRVPRNYINS